MGKDITLSAKKSLFRILFRHENRKIQIYAKSVFSSHFLGLVQIEDIVYLEQSKIMVDPEMEKVRKEFSDTRVLHIPLHTILRIEEIAAIGNLSKKNTKIIKMKNHDKKTVKKNPNTKNVHLDLPKSPIDPNS